MRTSCRRKTDFRTSYYRKAKAQQQLLKSSEAIDTLTAALSNPSFASEKGLNDALVEAYGGFPEDVSGSGRSTSDAGNSHIHRRMR